MEWIAIENMVNDRCTRCCKGRFIREISAHIRALPSQRPHFEIRIWVLLGKLPHHCLQLFLQSLGFAILEQVLQAFSSSSSIVIYHWQAMHYCRTFSIFFHLQLIECLILGIANVVEECSETRSMDMQH